MKNKSYREMNITQLVEEMARVKILLKNNKNYYAQKQNRKYLEKLEKEYYSYKKFKGE